MDFNKELFLELMDGNLNKKKFASWYYQRKEIQKLFGISIGFCLLGGVFFLIGIWIHNSKLYDVLFLMIGIGLLLFILLICAPFFAFARSFRRIIKFTDSKVEIYFQDSLTMSYPIKKIRVIYFFNDLILIEFKGISSLAIYQPDERTVQSIVSSLANTGIRAIEADSFFHVMVRKWRVRIL